MQYSEYDVKQRAIRKPQAFKPTEYARIIFGKLSLS